MPKRKPARRSSPRPSPQRDARRKLALAKSDAKNLVDTINGVKLASNPALLAKARENALRDTQEKDSKDGLDCRKN